jgi:5-methylcytosine-specific restriction endonuclease McrA
MTASNLANHQRDAQAIALYQRGLTSKKVARELGIAASTVQRVLRQARVQMRSARDYPTFSGQGHWRFRGCVRQGCYRRLAFLTYGKVCQRCGATERIEVHHRNRVHEDGRVENLEVLCRPCHLAEHHGDKWLEIVDRELARHQGDQRHRRRALPYALTCPANVLKAEAPRNGPNAGRPLPVAVELRKDGEYTARYLPRGRPVAAQAPALSVPALEAA